MAPGDRCGEWGAPARSVLGQVLAGEDATSSEHVVTDDGARLASMKEADALVGHCLEEVGELGQDDAFTGSSPALPIEEHRPARRVPPVHGAGAVFEVAVAGCRQGEAFPSGGDHGLQQAPPREPTPPICDLGDRGEASGRSDGARPDQGLHAAAIGHRHWPHTTAETLGLQPAPWHFGIPVEHHGGPLPGRQGYETTSRQ
jgi:hypothetical protein